VIRSALNKKGSGKQKKEECSNMFESECLCGSVKYETEGDPFLAYVCQCRTCQKLTGSGHSAAFMMPQEKVTISEDLNHFEYTSDQGNIVKLCFCPNCGNPIHKISSGYKGMIAIHASTLKDPSVFKPQKVFWAESGQAWDCVSSDLERAGRA
jgi:hypothetical protein